MKPIECFIHHHLGLGDHLICNGMVRYVAKNYDFKNIALVVKKCNLNNVTRSQEMTSLDTFDNVCCCKCEDTLVIVWVIK